MKVRRKKAKARPAQPDATEWLVGAFHEAAHAFEAHSLGLNVDRVTLDEDEAREANPTFIGFTSRECGTAEENARVALAGRVADAIMEDRLGLRSRRARWIESGSWKSWDHCPPWLPRWRRSGARCTSRSRREDAPCDAG